MPKDPAANPRKNG